MFGHDDKDQSDSTPATTPADAVAADVSTASDDSTDTATDTSSTTDSASDSADTTATPPTDLPSPASSEDTATADTASSDTATPAPSAPTPTPAATSTSSNDDLLSIKQQALQQLSPLVDHLDQTPEEKFRTTMMMIQAADNDSLIQNAYDAAQAIPDEKIRAQALLDIINEINYFTQQNSN